MADSNTIFKPGAIKEFSPGTQTVLARVKLTE